MQLAAMQHLHPDAALTMVMPDYVELNGFNLASHTTALEQSVLGKPHLLPKHNIVSSMPPTIIGKRSRSNSDASSCHSSSAGSSHASVFSSEIDASDNEYGSQTSIGEQTPCSRKCSMSEGTSSQHSLDDLAVWRAELLAREQSERERCAKRIRDLRGQVVRLASEVVHNASSSHSDAQPAIAVPAAVASISTSSILSASSSSSSTEEKNALVDTLVGK
uniref:Uncharacterized protein n=1 Tax=Melanopsichium pennsylvanicum 4 TaxID=1398559 RepID=A0A077RAL6_9BASI|nr:uncharacterized protein BN887_03608 [Melanopsichium pennsylvanicum 4]